MSRHAEVWVPEEKISLLVLALTPTSTKETWGTKISFQTKHVFGVKTKVLVRLTRKQADKLFADKLIEDWK